MKKSPSKPRARARAADVRVPVDASLKRAYDRLVATIAKASVQDASGFDARWEAAAAVIDHDPPLYVVGGYRNAAEFFREVMKEEPRTAMRFVRIARFASPQEEVRYGTAKLDAALGLLEAKLGHKLAHPPLPVALDKVRVSVGAGTKSLAEATVTELTAATGKLTGASRKRQRTDAERALEAALGRVASLRAIGVREKGGQVSFADVPLAAFGRFLGALKGVKL